MTEVAILILLNLSHAPPYS